MEKYAEKSQIGMEFMIVTGAVLFFFAVFLLVIQENISEKTKEKRALAFKETGLMVQNEIKLASSSTDGYYRRFKLPADIENLDYETNITSEMVYIREKNGKYSMAFPISNVTGDLVKGENIIRKENGKIYLNS